MLERFEQGERVFGRLEIERCIGAGGMASVYLVRDDNAGRSHRVLKVLHDGIDPSSVTAERFRNEILLTQRLDHPHIVRAFEHFERPDAHALLIEYMDGGDLSHKMRGRPLPPRWCATVVAQVASGLEAVHAEGIIHRDLKPENILFSQSGSVKISDFGLARLRGGLTLTSAGAMVGTPKYIAPEYIETGECDHRSDIYALGVLAYELLSGVSPVGNDTRLAAVVERLSKPVLPLLKNCPDCPPALAEIVERAMNFKLARRYQDARQLREDLEVFIRSGQG